MPGIYDPGLDPVIDSLDADSLLTVAERLRSLLGDDYAQLTKADARGRRSQTPPVGRHRLVELIEFAEETANRLSDWDGHGGFNLNGELFAESVTVLAAVTRWQNHPAWPSLRATLVSDTEAPHTVMLLTVASYLVDANNGVGVHLNPSRQKVTTADTWIEPSLGQRVDLEVKTPLALRSPTTSISEPHAVEIIERTLKKSSPQRRNTASNLLIIGGYHIGPSYHTLVATTKAMLMLERRKWRGLAGIIIADCTFDAGHSLDGGEAHFAPIARVEIAVHPGYRGDLSIAIDAEPTSALPPGTQPS